MEQERNKRAREYNNDNDDEAESKNSFENNNKKSKMRDVFGISFTNKENNNEVDCFKAWEWDSSNLALGVFDFPWLKDGVISKSEGSSSSFIDFEDSFLSSLKSHDTSFKVSGIDDFFDEYGFCGEASKTSMAHIPEAKLMEDVWQQPFEINGLEPEAEELDCIWSSLLNKPL